MEDINQPLEADTGAAPAGQPLQFSDAVRRDLLESAKWALFFAVLLFIVLGILTIISLMAAVAGGVMGIFGGLLVLGIYTLFFFFPAWYYYKFSTLARQALGFEDNEALEEAFVYLKRFYRFIGIFIIVFIGLYLLLAIAGLTAFISNDLFNR